MKVIGTFIQAAFTLVEIMVVVAIIGLLAAIAIPNFVAARGTVQSKTCINNLSKIDDVVSQFALENNKKVGDPIDYPSDLTPYLRLNRSGSIPACPAGGIYSEGAVGELPTCSLSDLSSAPHLLP